MIRSAVTQGLRTGQLVRRTAQFTNRALLLQKNSFSLTNSSRRMIGYRFLSSETGDKKTDDDKKQKEEGEERQIVLTPGQQVVAISRLTMWAGIGAFALVCAYYIGRELLPTKMSPNVVFNRALDVVRENPEIKMRFGTPLKGYGRDHGGKREGRRNFIEHTEYSDKEDGSKRTRVRFNLEGPHGRAFVFAEVSNQMKSGEFVYVLVQDKATGRVTTIIDNRAALAVQRMAAGSEEGKKVMNQLLTGSSGGK